MIAVFSTEKVFGFSKNSHEDAVCLDQIKEFLGLITEEEAMSGLDVVTSVIHLDGTLLQRSFFSVPITNQE